MLLGLELNWNQPPPPGRCKTFEYKRDASPPIIFPLIQLKSILYLQIFTSIAHLHIIHYNFSKALNASDFDPGSPFKYPTKTSRMPMSKEQAIPTVEELIQYQFLNSEKCWEALQGKGAGGFPHGNKNLALIGDAVVRARLAQKWYGTGGSTGSYLQ